MNHREISNKMETRWKSLRVYLIADFGVTCNELSGFAATVLSPIIGCQLIIKVHLEDRLNYIEVLGIK
jgi:hypothetical protein